MANVDAALQLKMIGLRMKALGAGGNILAAPGLGAGKTLRAQLLGSIRAAAKPAIEATRQVARDTLPKGGGLNEYIAAEKIKVSTRMTGPQVGVRIVAQSGQWNNGQSEVRHPVFGRKDRRWTTTRVSTPGWFSETLTRETPKMMGPLSVAMEAVAVEAMGRL